MLSRITLISHATTRDLRAATFGGDDSLDDPGRAAATRLAGRLGPVDQCWTSPARRARQTAECLGLAAAVDDRLRDCDFGRWSGLRFQQVLLREPRRLVSWMRKPDGAPHGGETIQQVVDRAAAWIGEPRPRGHVLAVSHPAFIRAAIVAVTQAALPSFWRFDVLPLYRVDLRTNGRRWVVRSIGPGLGDADE